jgi:hypothetical protein
VLAGIYLDLVVRISVTPVSSVTCMAFVSFMPFVFFMSLAPHRNRKETARAKNQRDQQPKYDEYCAHESILPVSTKRECG